MDLKQLISFLKESYVPDSYVLEKEYYGIQYGTHNLSNIKKVLLTINPSLSAIHYAIVNKFSLIISMFGLFNGSIKSFDISLMNKLKLASKHPLSIYVLNSSLIAASGGISDTLINTLYLKIDKNYNISGINGIDVPIGRICTPQKYPNSPDDFRLRDLVKRMVNNLNIKYLSYVGDQSRIINKINIIGAEICTSREIRNTSEEGCDCLVSCKLDYQYAEFALDLGLALVKAPFYEIALITFNRLLNILSLEFPYVEFHLFQSKNPINNSLAL
ncbi:MAG: Nif3-like dinuclear metal center hexameric protein [Promethearchaeota archaeon]